jgi:hypothetical protein
MMADRAQFEEERDFPYKQTQYMQSLLQGLPLAAQSYTYSEPSKLASILGALGGLQQAGGTSNLLSGIFSAFLGGGNSGGDDVADMINDAIALGGGDDVADMINDAITLGGGA